MNGQMHGNIMLLSHTLTMRGSDVASLVEFHPMVRRSYRDGQMFGWKNRQTTAGMRVYLCVLKLWTLQCISMRFIP